MDDHAVGVVGLIIWVAVGIVAAVGIAGGALYASDYGLGATVIDKSCASSGGGGGIFGGGSSNGGATSEVTVRTQMGGIEHTVKDFPNAQCSALRAGDNGNFVIYHLRTEHTILFEREGGSCIWDSEKGLGC